MFQSLVFNFCNSSITLDVNLNLITIYKYRGSVKKPITVNILVNDITKMYGIKNLHNFYSLKDARKYLYRYMKKNNIEYFISR